MPCTLTQAQYAIVKEVAMLCPDCGWEVDDLIAHLCQLGRENRDLGLRNPRPLLDKLCRSGFYLRYDDRKKGGTSTTVVKPQKQAYLLTGMIQ